jgi:hypothetical protein
VPAPIAPPVKARSPGELPHAATPATAAKSAIYLAMVGILFVPREEERSKHNIVSGVP